MQRATLEFLIELSIAVHRYAMYPADHPSLGPAAGKVLDRLSRLLEDRMELSLGVARRQLVIDGVATDVRNPVLVDLAKRLHNHQIGAITFSDEARVQGLVRLLRSLSTEPGDGEDALGVRRPGEQTDWPGVVLHSVGYQDLALTDGLEQGAHDPVMQLWLGLARAAMSAADASDPVDASPEELAEQMRRHREQAYDEVIVGYLLQISDELGEGGAGPVRARVSQLVAQLDRDTLRRILTMGGDVGQRRRFVRGTMGARLGTAAAMKILQAAADASEQEIPALLVRLLTKLSFHAEQGGGVTNQAAGKLVREKVDELLTGWTLENPNPEGYTRILDEFSRTSPYLDHPLQDEFEGSALSLVQMALEVDGYGPMVEQALDQLLLEGGLPAVAPLVEGARWTQAGKRMRARVADPARLHDLTQVEEVSESSLSTLVDLVGASNSVEPLLHVLAEAPSRAVRRTVFDQLVRLGETVVDHLPAFLEDPRWYVVRNMLALLDRLPRTPDGFDPLRFLDHVDVRVRRDALPLALADPHTRTRALVTALRCSDERAVRTALANLRQHRIPRSLTPVVLDRVVKAEDMPGALRAIGIRALRESREPSVRDALAQVAAPGRNLLGKPRLRSASGSDADPVFASIEVLARAWSGDRTVAPLLQVARRSRDASIQQALAAAVDRQPGPAPGAQPSGGTADRDGEDVWARA